MKILELTAAFIIAFSFLAVFYMSFDDNMDGFEKEALSFVPEADNIYEYKDRVCYVWEDSVEFNGTKTFQVCRRK